MIWNIQCTPAIWAACFDPSALVLKKHTAAALLFSGITFFEKGAFITDENGKLDVDVTKIEDGVKALSKDVLMIESIGRLQSCKSIC